VVACREGSGLDEAARAAGLETLHLPFVTELDPVSAWRLRGAALERGPSLLHGHTSHAAALAFWAAKGTDLPRVAHRRVSFPPGRGLDFSLKYKSADAVVAVSDFVRRLLLDAGLSPERAFAVPDACPAGLAPRAAGAARESRERLAAELRLPSGVPWLGNLAALTREKDQATLLKAFALARTQVPSARLLIAGEGPLRAALEALAGELGLADAVRFLGYRPDPAEILSCLDLYVHSSTDEGFGSVVLEAMALGVPVAAGAAGGLPELVKNGETGWLVPPGRPDALAAAVVEAMEPRAREARARAALARLPEFTIARMTDRMERVYEFARAGAAKAAA
jgi:glycosyltransferase involved in cell wall biosynthesis